MEVEKSVISTFFKLENQESLSCSSVQVQVHLRTRIVNGMSPNPSAEDQCLKSTVKLIGMQILFSVFLFYSCPPWIGWGPTILRKAIRLTETTNANANPIQKPPPRHSQKQCLPNIWILHDPAMFSHHTPSWITLVCCNVYCASSLHSIVIYGHSENRANLWHSFCFWRKDISEGPGPHLFLAQADIVDYNSRMNVLDWMKSQVS